MKLTPHLLKEAEYRRMIYEVTLEPETSYEDVFVPAFWAHVARRLKPRSRIEVHAADGSWYAELMVRSVTHVSAIVGEIRKVDFDEQSAGVDDFTDYDIKWRGGAKWSAVRKSDKRPVVEGLDTKDEVIAWLKKPQTAAAA